MRIQKPILRAAAAFVILAGADVLGSSISWTAHGLPPGLTIVTTNSTTGTAVIQGTPTTNGIWHAVIFPSINGVPGDMNPIEFNILPPGINLPLYHAYTRVPNGIKNGRFSAVSGGTYIFGKAGSKYLGLTANGHTFGLLGLPPGVTNSDNLVAAATIERNTLAIFRTFNPSNGVAMVSAFASTNWAAFQATPLPSDVANSSDGFALVADSGSFFLVGVSAGSFSYGLGGLPSNIPPRLRIWSRPATGSQWSTLFSSSINMQTANYYSTPSVSASLGFNGTNSSATRALTVGAAWFGDDAFRAVLNSTNAGKSWQFVTNAPRLTSVTYDGLNGRFVGAAANGVWASTNGFSNWQRLSTINVGGIVYSANRKLLFSTFRGVSSNGVAWLPYADYAYSSYDEESDATLVEPSRLVLNAAGNLIFLSAGGSSRQLSTVYVPSADALNQHGQVGKPFSYRVEVH